MLIYLQMYVNKQKFSKIKQLKHDKMPQFMSFIKIIVLCMSNFLFFTC